MTAGNGWHQVADLSEIPEDEGLGVRVADTAIALFRRGTDVYAVENYCPHQGSTLADGITRDGVVICPLHAWQFRIEDGSNLDGGPGLRTFKVKLEGQSVSVCV